MKIVFVTSFFGLSGGARVVAIHAGLLADMGHKVTIVSQPHPRPSQRQRLKARFAGGRLPEPASGEIYLEGLDIEHRVLETSRPVVDADLPDADAVVATWWETAYWVAALSPEKGRKFYFVQGHEVFEELPWQISRGSYYLPLKKIVVSQWLVDIMAETYGDHNAALVPNGVDMALFNAAPRTRQQRPTVGLLYSTAHFKGLDVCLAAIAEARAALPELETVAFGAVAPSPDLPLPPGTRYLRKPPQETIPTIYGSCDAWLVGSRSEGFGLPILEAMACRTPVIATQAGAAPDLIQDGVNGHVVPQEDSATMAARLTDVLSLPPAGWQAMSIAAHTTARESRWDRVAERLERCLLEALT